MKSHSIAQIDQAAEEAGREFLAFRNTPSQLRADLLSTIGDLINENRNKLVQTATAETNLPNDRLQTEVTRTVNQCHLFAALLREGSWVRAIIDRAQPERQPLPRPDLRQMQIALGPVAVFGASNFPFAYSVMGGDTVAALAAGCPVVYKVNPGHPQTSDETAELVQQAISKHNLPKGIFHCMHGAAIETGMRLVAHPAIKAVGFTGSLKGGRALFDAAAKRDEPIPVYAEMGSTNPVFILPQMLADKTSELAESLATSNTSSVGQFCTNPGIMIKAESDSAKIFEKDFAEHIAATASAPMLNQGVFNNFKNAVEKVRSKPVVSTLASSSPSENGKTGAFVFRTAAADFLKDHELWEEMFGPASLQVNADNTADMLEIARNLPGQITASVWGTDQDLQDHKELINYLQLKAGRIIINGVPTGVEVSPAMNHGGPYPATTDSKFTSVGTQSIYRFTRPICFQNYPQSLLPVELLDENPLKILRLVDGKWEK